MPEKDESLLLTELDNIIVLISTPEWKEFVKVLKAHKQHLQEEVNLFLRNGEYRLADRAEAKFEDIDKIFELFQRRLDELKQIKEEKDDSKKHA